MKAILLAQKGGPEILKITEVPEPTPGKGEVRVKLHYAGVNYAEILSRKGLYGWKPKNAYTPGMEGSGIIDAVGPGVDEIRLGQRVMVGTKFGCYAEKVVVPAHQAIPALDQFDMKESASFLVNYMTAWVALFEMAKVKPEETVLITAAAGGVGSAAVQLCAKLGCTVIGLASNQEKLEFIKNLGATYAINYKQTDYDQQIKKLTDGVDVVLEMVGGDIYKKNLNLLRFFGRIVVAGFASFNLKKWNPFSWYKTYKDLPRIDIATMSHKSIGIFAFHLGYLLKDIKRTMDCFFRLREFVSLHDIRPVIGKIFPLEHAADAHRYIESRKSMGKVLLKMD
ncbi:MAG: zinc-binding dehydrogenase [Caldisericaceae bacterium]|nr:zinc-binding dehydrogenase [Caldisericaceae bacterium]